jgi:glycosyltransferase involved in cell wall biosynthesis
MASGDPAAPPEVSVVVPTRERAARLAVLLDSLAGQRGAAFELIVVDDASTDGTSEVLARVRQDLDLRAVRLGERRGPGAARNAGWRRARAPLVAFIDDDCVARQGWLQALVAAHRRVPHALLQGRTEPHPEELQKQNAFSLSQLVLELGPHFQACNIAYPRELLERLGGFDESFPHYCEDADLAWRAQEGGAPALFVPEAAAWHAVHRPGAVGLIRDSQRWVGGVRAFARHPGLRRHFRHGVFWKPSHERLLLAAAGVALASRTRGASLLLSLPYLRLQRTQHGSSAGLLVLLPAHVGLDLAEIVAMVRGSVRYRTLVL